MSRCNRCDFRETSEPNTPTLTHHALESGHPLCAVNQRHSLHLEELQTCARCVGVVRSDLVTIVETYVLLPAELERHANAAIPGGSPLVMLAAGSSGIAQWRAHVTGGDSSHMEDEIAGEVGSVASELAGYEDDWRHVRRQEARVVPAAGAVSWRDQQQRTLVLAAAYLNRQLGWAAAYHPEFPAFAADVRRIAGALENATSTGERPEVGAPCFDCGGRLERMYADYDEAAGSGGRLDYWTCRRCKRVYDDASYWLAVRAQYEEAVNG